MSFASRSFFIFLPLVLLGYYLLPGRSHKFRFLLAASWFFYLSWNPWFIWVILFTSVVDYYAGIFIEGAPTPRRRRGWLWLSLAANLGLLAAFKYTGFAVANSLTCARYFGWDVPDWTVTIVLPLGISFHTFQGISYTLDVYRNKIRAVRSFADFALFVAFFPQLVAGPIVRAVEFLPQMETPPRATVDQIVEGLNFFIIGFFKKCFLADQLARIVDPVFAQPHIYDNATLVWAAAAYSGQIYCDFSGYSDLAIGCAKWFGFELPENFRFPFMASNIADFWRRWHITLSTWLRDYFYVAMGGSRGGSLRTYLNLLLTMTLCGLWHGPSWNFILWGFYNGALLVAHRAYDRMLAGRPWADRLRTSHLYQLLCHIVTLWTVLAGFVLIRAETWAGCWHVESALIGSSQSLGATHFVPFWAPLLLGFIVVGHLFSGVRDRRCGILQLPPLLRAGAYLAAVSLLLVFGPATTKSFIYFHF